MTIICKANTKLRPLRTLVFDKGSAISKLEQRTNEQMNDIIRMTRYLAVMKNAYSSPNSYFRGTTQFLIYTERIMKL